VLLTTSSSSLYGDSLYPSPFSSLLFHTWAAAPAITGIADNLGSARAKTAGVGMCKRPPQRRSAAVFKLRALSCAPRARRRRRARRAVATSRSGCWLLASGYWRSDRVRRARSRSRIALLCALPAARRPLPGPPQPCRARARWRARARALGWRRLGPHGLGAAPRAQRAFVFLPVDAIFCSLRAMPCVHLLALDHARTSTTLAPPVLRCTASPDVAILSQGPYDLFIADSATVFVGDSRRHSSASVGVRLQSSAIVGDCLRLRRRLRLHPSECPRHYQTLHVLGCPGSVLGCPGSVL
jgi:hypothetical protein